MHYIYTQYERDTQKVLFECDAENILKADALFTVAVGTKPEKMNNVGCWSPDWWNKK